MGGEGGETAGGGGEGGREVEKSEGEKARAEVQRPTRSSKGGGMRSEGGWDVSPVGPFSRLSGVP